MLKRPDAAFITGTGRGYFQVGNDEIFEEFQSGWSGAEYEPEVPFTDDKNVKVEHINLIGKSGVPKGKKKKKSDNIAKGHPAGRGGKIRRQDCRRQRYPPIKTNLDASPAEILYLDELAAIPKPEASRCCCPSASQIIRRAEPVPVAVDFLSDGHLLVCGAGGSGRTTLLQTLIYSACERYSAAQVNLYIADFSSRTMAVFGALPMWVGCCLKAMTKKSPKCSNCCKKRWPAQERIFPAGHRLLPGVCHPKGRLPGYPVLYRQLHRLYRSYEQYEDTLAQLSREAASYGIYLVLSMNNSGELRSRIRQNFTFASHCKCRISSSTKR
jgi:S-DNA-T family DNA segregation ATPase FtsK/SpoIIIE